MTRLLKATTLAASMALALAMGAKAELDTDIAGYWYMQTPDEKIMKLHIEPDGKFQKRLGAKTLASGMLSVKDGKWSMKGDAGIIDKGAFKLNVNRMELTSKKSGTEKWSRTMPVVPATGMIPESAFKLNVVPKAKTADTVPENEGEKKTGEKKSVKTKSKVEKSSKKKSPTNPETME
jgi:hypothetical protein